MTEFDVPRLEAMFGKAVIASGNAALFDLDAARYHTDPLWEPSLSASIAKVLINDSPLHAYLQHPRLGNVPKKPTPAMERGTLIHDLVLGQIDPQPPKPDPLIDVCEFKDWRTKAAREAKHLVLARGRIPKTPAEYDKYEVELAEQWEEMQDAIAVANCVLDHLGEAGLMPDGLVEHVGVWQEDTSIGPVLCRCRIDNLWPATAGILDLKTTWKAKPEMLPKTILDLGYDVQQAAYTSFVRKLLPDMAGRESFTFAFCEELPAGSDVRAITVPATINGEFRAIGDAKWARACKTWRECLDSNKWPHYAGIGILTRHMEPPAWAMASEMTKEVA